MAVTVITPPEAVVTLDDAKAHLRVDHEDDDTLIEGYIAAATAHLDGPAGWLGRALGPQTLQLTDAAFCGRNMRLPFPPVTGGVVLAYLDEDGVEQVIDSEDYSLVDNSVWLADGFSFPATGCFPDAVRITYEAGYEELPAPIRVAILMLVAHWYANREAVTIGTASTELPIGVKSLLAPFVVYR